jgi:hypothetical protein
MTDGPTTTPAQRALYPNQTTTSPDARHAKVYSERPLPPSFPPSEDLRTEEILYPVKTSLLPTFERHWDAATDVLGYTTTQKQEYARNTVAMTEEGRLPIPLATKIVDLQMADATAAARGTAADVAQRTQTWNEEIRLRLRNEYGTKGYDIEDLVRRANKFIGAHSRLHAALSPNGLYANPEVFLGIVDLVRTRNYQ